MHSRCRAQTAVRSEFISHETRFIISLIIDLMSLLMGKLPYLVCHYGCEGA